MWKKHMIVIVILLAAVSSLSAAWRPAVEVNPGVNLTKAVAFEDSAPFRTSISSELNLLLLNWSVGKFELGAGVSALTNTDTPAYGGVRNLGFLQFGCTFRAAWNLISFYSLSLELGAGYGLFFRNESGFAHLTAGVGQIFRIDPFVAITQKFLFSYRTGMLDCRITTGFLLSFRGQKDEN